MNRTLNATMRGLILLLVPISALAVAQATPIVYFVYSHTRLRAGELQPTAAALAVFSLSMFAWGAQNILARGFYAAHDTITPAVTGTAITLLSLPFYRWMAHHYQYLGLAVASTVGITVLTLLLFILLNHRTKNRETAEIVWFFFKVTAASVIAAGLCYELTQVLHASIGWETTLHALAVLVIVSTVGFVLTAVLAKLFRVRELDSYLARLRS